MFLFTVKILRLIRFEIFNCIPYILYTLIKQTSRKYEKGNVTTFISYRYINFIDVHVYIFIRIIFNSKY